VDGRGKRWKEKKQSRKENPNFVFVCTLGTKQPLLDRAWTAKEMALPSFIVAENHHVQNLLP
jgi:hypothetical protein